MLLGQLILQCAGLEHGPPSPDDETMPSSAAWNTLGDYPVSSVQCPRGYRPSSGGSRVLMKNPNMSIPITVPFPES